MESHTSSHKATAGSIRFQRQLSAAVRFKFATALSLTAFQHASHAN